MRLYAGDLDFVGPALWQDSALFASDTPSRKRRMRISPPKRFELLGDGEIAREDFGLGSCFAPVVRVDGREKSLGVTVWRFFCGSPKVRQVLLRVQGDRTLTDKQRDKLLRRLETACESARHSFVSGADLERVAPALEELCNGIAKGFYRRRLKESGSPIKWARLLVSALA